ncbi:MAG: hypothetical protein ACJAUP_000044 [Cellvibrionaceae bacterium]|jgi:hypothetical protein
MPHASSLRELAFATSLTNNYRYCAKHIIFSSPEYDEDSEQLLLTSRLIDDIPLEKINIDNQSDFLLYSQSPQESQQWKTIDCKQGPPVSNKDLNDKRELGGAETLSKHNRRTPLMPLPFIA